MMIPCMPSSKTKRAFTFGCDCCGDPIYMNVNDDPTQEMLLLYRSKGLAEIAGSTILPTPLPIIEIKITVDTYGTKPQKTGGHSS